MESDHIPDIVEIPLLQTYKSKRRVKWIFDKYLLNVFTNSLPTLQHTGNLEDDYKNDKNAILNTGKFVLKKLKKFSM